MTNTEQLLDSPSLTTLLRGLTSDEVNLKDQYLTGETKITYGELRDRVARTQRLFALLKVRAGDRVAIATKRDDAVAYLYGACLLGGQVAVVLDPDASAAEATVLMAKAQVDAAFLDSELLERAENLRSDHSGHVVAIADGAKTKTGFGLMIRKRNKAAIDDTYPARLDNVEPLTEMPDLPEDAPALILFTSGTTSQPKGVVLTRANLAAQITTFRNQYGYGPESRIANHLPLHHTDGLNQGVLLTFGLGSTWIRPGAVDLQSLGEMLDLLHRERCTHLVTVPTVIAMMTRLPDVYDDAFRGPDFAFISSTAGFLDPGIWERVEQRFGTMIVNSYGLTETVMETLYCGPTAETRRIGTIGKPVDCEVRIVDDEDRDVPQGEIGELLVRGANVMPGYFENPEANAAIFHEGWLRTGDLATVDADGFYSIAGRKKNVIVRGGTNVYPEDVNAVILSSDAVASVSTIAMPDTFLGERVVSCIVAAEAGFDEAAGVEALFAHCREHLATEKIPNQIHVLDQLPYGPSGKVELAKLTQMVSEREQGGSVDGGSTDTRSQVLSIAASVFREPVDSLDERSSSDSTQGWDSLSFLELIMSLEQTFDIDIDPRDVMNMRSLGDAIDVVERR